MMAATNFCLRAFSVAQESMASPRNGVSAHLLLLSVLDLFFLFAPTTSCGRRGIHFRGDELRDWGCPRKLEPA